MNEKRKEEYVELKDGIMVTNNAISNCRGRIVRIESDINEKRATIADIKAKLEVEDRAIASPSRLNKPTMTAVQYLAHQDTIKTIEDQLPELNEQLEYQSRSLALLESELRDKHGALKYARELLVADMVDKSINELVESSCKEITNLVMAIIAASGKQKGFNYEVKERFKIATYTLICDKLLPGLFDGNELPDLHEANQYVEAIIEAA